MNSQYTFEDFEKNLDEGYQIYCTYVRNRYLIFKTSENCYTQKLLSEDEKNPLAKNAVITHKRLKEMFPFTSHIETVTVLTQKNQGV